MWILVIFCALLKYLMVSFKNCSWIWNSVENFMESGTFAYAQIFHSVFKNCISNVCHDNCISRAPDKVRKKNFNRLYLSYFFTKFYVWPLVRIVSTSRWDDSDKWSNIEIGGKIGILEIEIRTLSGALYKGSIRSGKYSVTISANKLEYRYCKFHTVVLKMEKWNTCTKA